MINLAVFFGGRTVEHDVSVVTAQQLIQNVDRTKYHVIPVYITRDGDWFSGEPLCGIEAFRRFDKSAPGVERVYLPANTRARQLFRFTPHRKLFGKEESAVYAAIDVALLAMHGLNGEDGSLQGLLQLAGIPFTSSGVLGSASGMDKILMKAAFRGAGLPVLPYTFFDRDAWRRDRESILQACEAALPYPMFVKPSNLGSSIGISRAKDRAELAEAIELAVQYDHRILVEEGLDNPVEINCSGLGFGDEVTSSVCEMPNAGGFLSFSTKYLNGGKTQAGMEALARQIPAPIPDEMTARIRKMTEDIFRLMDCKGVVRIDYICSQDLSLLYVNEINTIPGSMAFYLWEPLGISYSDLIDRLVQYALAASDALKSNNFAFDSEIISTFASGSAKVGKMGKGGWISKAGTRQ